jgi:hypothetical protein
MFFLRMVMYLLDRHRLRVDVVFFLKRPRPSVQQRHIIRNPLDVVPRPVTIAASRGKSPTKALPRNADAVRSLAEQVRRVDRPDRETDAVPIQPLPVDLAPALGAEPALGLGSGVEIFQRRRRLEPR